ncbi:MAG: histidine kinase dimerization/phosphoacceptor domain -containing protein [Syntrophus sp. (in: bacteria)]
MTSRAIFPWRSLKTKVTLFTLVIFLAGIWSLAFYASYTLQSDLEHLLGDQQFSTVSIIASDLNQELEDRIKALEIIAAKITPAMLGNAASMQTFLESHASFPILFNYGGIVLRLDGVAIAEVPNHGRIGVNYRDRDYMIPVLKGKTTISEAVVGKTSHAPFFSMLVPIRDPKGKVIGVLAGATDLSKPNFLSKITDNFYGKTGGYLLVSPKIRTIVFATDKKRTMEVLPAPGVNPLIDRFIQGYEGYGITTRPGDGLETLSSAKGVPVAGWYVVALMPTKEAFAPAHDLQRRVLLATIFLTLLVGGLTWWILKRQLSPVFATIKKLTAMADAEHPPRPLPITTQDEIGELIGGFNHLLETLDKRGEALKESEERFHKLADSTWEGIVIHREGIIMDANESFLKMSGTQAEEVIGKSVIDFLAPESIELALQKLREGAAHDQLYLEVKGLRKDKTVIVAEVLGRPIRYKSIDARVLAIRDISQRKQAEEALRASLTEKEVLLREIHHRVKNNLAALGGLIQMQRRSVKSAATIAVLTDLDARIRSMAIIHEMFYQSDNLNRIDFHDYLDKLISQVRTSLGLRREIRFRVAAKGVEMVLDDAMPCGLLVNELITNAIKYAFPETSSRSGAGGREISVTAECDDDAYTLSVADNGIGLPADIEWTTTSTLGLHLVRMLGEHQLGGRIELDRAGGTRFVLKFKSRHRK